MLNNVTQDIDDFKWDNKAFSLSAHGYSVLSSRLVLTRDKDTISSLSYRDCISHGISGRTYPLLETLIWVVSADIYPIQDL